MQPNLAIQKLAAAISDAQDGNFVSLRKKDAIALLRLLTEDKAKASSNSLPPLPSAGDQSSQGASTIKG